MKIPALLLSLLLPSCGEGLNGIVAPPPMDVTAIVRPGTPNTALAAPAGFEPAPDLVTSVFTVAPTALYAAIRAIAASQPRTFLSVAFQDRLQAHFVARSAFLGFPDLVAVQVLATATPDRSLLVIYSRSIYGRSDYGVNRKRVVAWLAALDSHLGGGRLA